MNQTEINSGTIRMESSHNQASWKEHKGVMLDSVEGFEVIDCSTCGFKHIIPIPTAEEIENAYRQRYYSTEKPLYFEHTKEDLDWWNLVYGERYDLFEKLLPSESRRILDVGSGPGFFLLHGKQRSWQTMGIEPSKQAVAYSRKLGLEIVEDFLTEQVAEKLGVFDVIYMSNVLEHIPNPKEMLILAAGMISSDGLLYIDVPNDYNPFQYVLRTGCGYRPWWVSPPHHINYFDFDSLERLFTSCGFDVVSRHTTFPIDIFLLMGDNYVGNDALGRQCHSKRKVLEFNLAKAGMGDLKRKLYKAFASLGIGREAQIIGRKNNL
jgi:SAM-dependent methyltransferase